MLCWCCEFGSSRSPAPLTALCFINNVAWWSHCRCRFLWISQWRLHGLGGLVGAMFRSVWKMVHEPRNHDGIRPDCESVTIMMPIEPLSPPAQWGKRFSAVDSAVVWISFALQTVRTRKLISTVTFGQVKIVIVVHTVGVYWAISY